MVGPGVTDRRAQLFSAPRPALPFPIAVLREAWESEAEDWVRWARAPGHDSYWTFHRDAFLALLPGPGRLTLDVGCGEGRLARDLAELGHLVIALDASPTMVRYAASAGGTLGTLVADGARLPFPDGAADLAVAFMSLHDMDDLPGSVGELSRVLEPGGRVCLAILHPVNSGHVIDRRNRDHWVIEAGSYWADRRTSDTEERDGLHVTFHSVHRPLERYFAALEGAGLLTETVREPRGPASVTTSRSFPFFLHLRARKPR